MAVNSPAVIPKLGEKTLDSKKVWQDMSSEDRTKILQKIFPNRLKHAFAEWSVMHWSDLEKEQAPPTNVLFRKGCVTYILEFFFSGPHKSFMTSEEIDQKVEDLKKQK